jgi:hypothetical protein
VFGTVLQMLSVDFYFAGMSYSAPKVVQLSEYVAAAGLSNTYVFVVCNRNNLIMKQGLWNIAIQRVSE